MAAVYTATEDRLQCRSEGLSSVTVSDGVAPLLVNATNIKVEDTSEDPGYTEPVTWRRHAAAPDAAPVAVIKEERVEDEEYVQVQLGDVEGSSDDRPREAEYVQVQLGDAGAGADDKATETRRDNDGAAHGDWLFHCVDCGEAFEQRELYQEHRHEHIHDGPIVCLDSDSQWNDLLVSEDGGRRTLCCALCGRIFSSSRGFFTHQLKHRTQALKQEPVTEIGGAVNKQRVFECADCGKTYSSVGLYLNHQRSHKQASKSVFHQLAHLKKKSFQCPTCGRCYSRASALDAHRRCHEVKLIKPRAASTDKILPSLEAEEEMNGEETGDEKKSRSLNCSECGKTFRSLSGLNIHQRSCCNSKYPEIKPKEEIKRSFNCPECGKSFISNTALACHQRWHVRRAKISSSGQSLACEECGKVFSSLTFYHKHKRLVHSQQTPAKSFLHQVFQLQKKAFECQDCGRRFSRASALQSHQLCHTDVFADVIEGVSQKPAVTATPPQKLYLCDKEKPKSFAIGTLAYSQGTPQSSGIRDQLNCKDSVNVVGGDSEHFNVEVFSIPGSDTSRDENAPTESSTEPSSESTLNPEDKGEMKLKGSASPLRSKAEVYVELEVEPVSSKENAPTCKVKNFECPECGRKFASASAIRCHRLWHKRPMGRAAGHKTWAHKMSGRNYLKKLFKCNDCGKESHTLSSHHLHLQQHERPKPYKSLLFQLAGLQKNAFECKECGMRFSRASALQSHQQHHATPKRTHECSLCDKAYSSHGALYNHRKTCHGEWSRQDPASNVKEKTDFNPRKSLLGPKVYHCERCGKGFWSLGAFSQHTQSQQCPEVKESSNLPESLISVGSHSRTAGKRAACGICGKKFRHRGYLACHMKRHRSTPEKNHRCEVCGKSYRMLACFLKHQQVHDGYPPPVKSFQHQVEQVKKNTYVCPDCGKRFSRAMALQFHMRSHGYETGHPFTFIKSADGSKLLQCPNCSDHFSNEADLNDHLSKNHASNARKAEESTCIQERIGTGIPKPFRRKDLQAESNDYVEPLKDVSKKPLESSELPPVRSDLGKYECGECGRRFSVIGALNFHKRIHLKDETATDETLVFMCQDCGRSFNTKSALGRHRRWHANSRCADVKCNETLPFTSHLDSNCTNKLMCSSCNMAFCSMAALQRHQSQVHFSNVLHDQPGAAALIKVRCTKSKKTKSYECLECSKRFCKAKGLRVHRWHMHRGSGKAFRTALKPFPCTGCEKRYSSQGALYNHRKICAMVRRKLRQQKTLMETPVPARRFSEPFNKCLFKCQKCGKAFPSMDRLEAHHDIAKSRPHCCALCCRGYWSETQLQQHLAWHDEVRRRLPADLRYRLSTSGTAVRTTSGSHDASGLKQQTAPSSGPPTALPQDSPACSSAPGHHKCPLCEEVFQTTLALKQHRLSHSNCELYPCSLCPQTFSRIQDLIDHHQECMGDKERQADAWLDLAAPHQSRQSSELMCIECGITFNQEVALHQHYIEHARGEFGVL